MRHTEDTSHEERRTQTTSSAASCHPLVVHVTRSVRRGSGGCWSEARCRWFHSFESSYVWVSIPRPQPPASSKQQPASLPLSLSPWAVCCSSRWPRPRNCHLLSPTAAESQKRLSDSEKVGKHGNIFSSAKCGPAATVGGSADCDRRVECGVMYKGFLPRSCRPSRDGFSRFSCPPPVIWASLSADTTPAWEPKHSTKGRRRKGNETRSEE